MKHQFKDFQVLSVFRWNGQLFEKQSEQWAAPINADWSRGPVVPFSIPDEWVDIVSGQSRLKPGSPLYDEDYNVTGYVGPCQRRT